MAYFLLDHRHEPHECSVAFAAWRGFDSPLRHRRTFASCLAGEHAIGAGTHRVWWFVSAPDAETALSQLPFFVAQRTHAVAIGDVAVP
jgi:hypothetical protein